MNYADRAAQNALTAQAIYYNARSTAKNSTDTGTPMGIDGATGRTLIIAGDGLARTNSIASSNQLAITSPFVGGNNGNAGFSDGRTA